MTKSTVVTPSVAPTAASPAPVPESVTPVAPATEREPAAEPAGVAPLFEIRQHLLSSDGESRVEVPIGTRLLDIHLIDGRYNLRTCEPVVDDPDTRTLRVVPAALGTKLTIGRLSPLVVRSGGIHFFAEA